MYTERIFLEFNEFKVMLKAWTFTDSFHFEYMYVRFESTKLYVFFPPPTMSTPNSHKWVKLMLS